MLRRAVAAAASAAHASSRAAGFATKPPLPSHLGRAALQCKRAAGNQSHDPGAGRTPVAESLVDAKTSLEQCSVFRPWVSMANVVPPEELHSSMERYWTTLSIVSSVLASMGLSCLVSIPGWGKIDTEYLKGHEKVTTYVLDDVLPTAEHAKPLVVGLVSTSFFMSSGSLMVSTILLSGISWIPQSGAAWFVRAHAPFLRLPFILLAGSVVAGGFAVLAGLQIICPSVTLVAVVLGALNGLLMLGLTARMLSSTHAYRRSMSAAAQKAGQGCKP